MGDVREHAMATTIKLAEYLFTRLRQLGIDAVHGVPGDYNLNLLDFVELSSLLWVGNANELNAGYAADGYARIKGIGALVTTYGVGELSAINAIAGANTERAAVIHIVGTPPRNSQESRLMIHHTMGDGDYRHFGQIASHVTVAQANLLDPRTAAEMIDATLKQCLLHSKPVYIEIPVDMVEAPLSTDRLATGITIPDAAPQTDHDIAIKMVLDKISASKQPIILVDSETRSLGLQEHVQEFVNATKWPTFTSSGGNGLVDMGSTNVYGIYQGRFGDSRTKTFFDESDLVLCFGPHFSSTNSHNWTGVPKTEVTISFTYEGVRIGSELVRSVPVKKVLQELLQKLGQTKTQKYTQEPDLPRHQVLSFSEVSPSDHLKQDKVWKVLANFIRTGDILFGETGTAGYGVREMLLPSHVQVFTPMTWLSIGYMLPASQGAALAQRELVASNKYHGISKARTVLIIGDGSFQMTCQELATIIRHNLNVVIFLINNDGYTIERCIHGKNQGYNDVSRLRYLKALDFFGAPENSFTASARTYGELEQVLKDPKLTDGEGVRMVEVFLDRDDAPVGPLLDLMNKQK